MEDSVCEADTGIGTFNIVKPVAEAMVAQRRGRIVAIGSIAGQRALPDGLAYSTSKAGLEGLIRRVAFDLGAHGITANVVAPGAIATNGPLPLGTSASNGDDQSR